MFQFSGFASAPYVFRCRYLLRGGFPHSEILGSKPVCRLPEAYRRLPRLSSPVAAKASTICAYSLDHITPRRRPGITWAGSLCQCNIPRLSAYALNLKTSQDLIGLSLRLTLLIPNCKRTTLLKIKQKATDVRIVRCLLPTREMVEPAGIEPATPSLQS